MASSIQRLREVLAPLAGVEGDAARQVVPDVLRDWVAADGRSGFESGDARSRLLYASVSRPSVRKLLGELDKAPKDGTLKAPEKFVAVLTVCAEHASAEVRLRCFPAAVGASGRAATCRAFVAALVPDEADRQATFASAIGYVDSLLRPHSPGVEALREDPGAGAFAATAFVFALWAIVDLAKTTQLQAHFGPPVPVVDVVGLGSLMFAALAALAWHLVRRIQKSPLGRVDFHVRVAHVGLGLGTFVAHVLVLALLGLPLGLPNLVVAVVPAASFALRLFIPAIGEVARASVILVELLLILLVSAISGGSEGFLIAVTSAAIAFASARVLARVRPDWKLVAVASP